VATKKEQLAQEVAKAVGAGKAVALETVDFNDPNRPKTCLEVDFPILPVNQVAINEGNAGKPIYQMSKWWARRRSSVFRSMLIAAATKAPEDKSHAAKLVWDNYYANHQKKAAFKHLKVADIFMGGGTTLVEGSRLGMQMCGNDLNPVAWFVVKQELANVDLDEVKRLLADIEAEVKPQIMPYYYCDGPNGEKGKWTNVPTGRVEGPDFDPLKLTIEQRREYRYEGPEIIYTFWAKHGPCQVTGCGHRTPIMSSPVMAVKSLTVKYWEQTCGKCGGDFHVEENAARMTPDVPLYVSPDEYPHSVLDLKRGVVCPHCDHAAMVKLGKGKNKKVELSLLVHPQWLAGSPRNDANGQPFGGSAQDDAISTARWNQKRAERIRLLEVRGILPDAVTCPETKVTFSTGKEGGTIPKKSSYACGACGTVQDVLGTVKASGKTGPMAGYAIQGYAPKAADKGEAYNGRFFGKFDEKIATQYDAALIEWDVRKDGDLSAYWPRSELPFGFMTHLNNGGIPNHGFTHWWTMFNPRQLLVHTLLLKAIVTEGDYDWPVREYVLGAFQQYLRNQCMFSFWNPQRDTPEPMFSNNNYHPKATVIENCVFPSLGRGNWASSVEGILEGRDWAVHPWEAVSLNALARTHPELAAQGSGKSEKVYPGDPVKEVDIFCGSSTELAQLPQASVAVWWPVALFGIGGFLLRLAAVGTQEQVFRLLQR
jgi:putative DNA methylase